MNTLDMLANEILQTRVRTTTKEAYEYAKFLKNYTKSLHYNLKNKR